MSEPSREHIEAVASLIDEWLYRMHGIQSSCRHEVEAAELLSTKDPAVLDAMQDALVRAGRLTESREMETFFDGFDQIIRETARTRLVTDWREVDR